MRKLLLLAFLVPVALAEDWPEWRGPRRDGIARDATWLDAWPADKKPPVLWRAEVGKGHSAVSVSRGLAYTMGWNGRDDTVVCLDAATGKVVWKHSYPCATIVQWPGPRSTPTVAADRVYTLSQHGLVYALDAKTGQVAWKVQLPASYMPDVDYGFASSPLVEGDLVILGTGQRGLALRAKDGSFAWGNDGKAGACASPVRCEIDGKRVVVVLSNENRESVCLVGVEPATGKELWRSEPWPEKWGAACVDPVVSGGSLFLTTAEQHGECARFSLVAGKLQRDWANRRLSCYTGSCVLVGGHLFGVTKAGLLKCLDWKTGAEKWAARGFDGHGALTAVNDRLLIQASQSGDLVVAETGPAKYVEVRRASVFTGAAATFTAPVVANGRIYCRSYAGEVVCLGK